MGINIDELNHGVLHGSKLEVCPVNRKKYGYPMA